MYVHTHICTCREGVGGCVLCVCCVCDVCVACIYVYVQGKMKIGREFTDNTSWPHIPREITQRVYVLSLNTFFIVSGLCTCVPMHVACDCSPTSVCSHSAPSMVPGTQKEIKIY